MQPRLPGIHPEFSRASSLPGGCRNDRVSGVLGHARSRSGGVGWSWWWRLDEPSPPTSDSGDSKQQRQHRLEAVLFLAREPLNARKLAQLADLTDGTEARTLIRRLNQHYRRVQRAFRVEQVAGGYRLMTRPQYSGWLRRLGEEASGGRWSAPALETLAVIAYRQPVLRAEIEAIRGVSCGELLRQLMDRNLVRISGRSEELGRPFLYSTTKTFLSTFGLNSLDDLPRSEELRRRSSEVDPQPGVSARAYDAHVVALPSQEDADVTVTAKRPTGPADETELKKPHLVPGVVMRDDEDDDFGYEDDEEDEDEDEEEEDFEEEEEDFDDEESEDEDLEDEDEDEEEWEEVEDEEDSEADEADEDEDFEDDEDWDDEESEEEDEDWDDDEDEDADEEEEEEEDDWS